MRGTIITNRKWHIPANLSLILAGFLFLLYGCSISTVNNNARTTGQNGPAGHFNTPVQMVNSRDVHSILLERKGVPRSEEHTSELQSRGHLVCRLLLEKKKRTAT